MEPVRNGKKTQQIIIRGFYKEFISWRTENIGNWIGAGFCQVLFWVCIAVPFQEIIGEGESDGIMMFMGMALGWLPSFLIAKLFPVSMVLQLLTTWYSYGEISLQNICYVIVAAGLWPLLLNLPVALFSRRYQ